MRRSNILLPLITVFLVGCGAGDGNADGTPSAGAAGRDRVGDAPGGGNASRSGGGSATGGSVSDGGGSVADAAGGVSAGGSNAGGTGAANTEASGGADATSTGGSDVGGAAGSDNGTTGGSDTGAGGIDTGTTGGSHTGGTGGAETGATGGSDTGGTGGTDTGGTGGSDTGAGGIDTGATGGTGAGGSGGTATGGSGGASTGGTGGSNTEPSQCVVRVDAASTATNPTGNSWADAFATVNPALANAQARLSSSSLGCNGHAEVWVAAGTYTPEANKNRALTTFQLRSGVWLLGGFSGAEQSADARDFEANVTVLSGNAGAPDNQGDDACHVVTGAQNATLDGFTLVEAYNTGCTPESGAGIYSEVDGVTIANCVISGFTARRGAGAYLSGGTVDHCTFADNVASPNGGFDWGGAGIYSEVGVVEVTDCLFEGNHGADGAGAYIKNGTITRSDFVGNWGANGAGVHLFNGTVTDSLFSDNDAYGRGGAIDCETLVVEGTDFLRNVSDEGGAIYVAQQVEISGSTFTENVAEEGSGAALYIVDDHSSLTTNLVADSVFVHNTAEGDGGAIYGMARVERSRFVGNRSEQGDGGAVCALDLSNIGRAEACLFIGNYAQGTGGATRYVEALDSVFARNEAAGACGAGAVGDMTRCISSNNRSATSGGGACSAVIDSRVTGNQAGGIGGGVFIWYPDHVTRNSVVAGNHAGAEAGGLYAVDNDLLHMTVVSNTSVEGASGVDGRQPTLAYWMNSIIYDNDYSASSNITIGRTSLPGHPYPVFAGYPLASGVWSSVAYDETLLQTVLRVATDSWEPGALAKLFVRPDMTSTLWSTIADNDADAIYLWGDLTADFDGAPYIEAGDEFELYDLRLASSSPYIDNATGQYTTHADIDGVFRHDQPGVSNRGE
ncbi:MAG: hypothetical protein JW751_20645, partial [Polyangiaceae bacterium]|nr:hypothetical protein [Polyangiaceae bacterium]